ncbi:MAG TPA: hypothetical protein VK505_02255, partial [Steroidobacteraceae bacterium]|nr:hypothetical protein [Steroidobacteraceae bacterium]
MSSMRYTLAVGLALVLALLPCVSGAAAASTGLYQVEIIIFQSVAPPAGEDLSASAEGRGFSGQLERGTAPPAVLRRLDASEMQLGGLASR